MTEPRALLHQLLEYVGEQAKDIDPRGFRLEALKGFLRRPRDIAGLPGVETDLQVAGDHVWLRVPRLIASKPHAVSEQFKGLIRAGDDPDGPPPSVNEAGLLHRLHKESEGKSEEERKALEEHTRAALAKALEAYSILWKSWAEGERPRRRTIGLYGDLFALRQQLEAEETAKPQEFVWGIGVASWKLKYDGGSFDLEYPLITQAVEVVMDDKTMSMEIRPRVTEPRVEFDPFVACQVQAAAEIERTIREHLAKNREHPVSPFDGSSYSDVLKLAAGGLDSNGSYREILTKGEQVPAAAERLVVTNAWVLFARPRSNNYLFEDLKRLQDRIAQGCEIPAGPLAFVTPPSDEPLDFESVRFRGLSSRGTRDGGTKPQELYFPLPYNDEQVSIVQRLEKAPGVCVQGPPGTGKTHTIANIICHYLATGRRVLVTSRGAKALDVLQEKIPEQVRALTVSLLASDRESVRQFEAAIQAIQHRVSQLNPALTQQQIETLMSAIDRAHQELAKIDERVDAIAMSQLSDIEVDGHTMRAQKLAELVVSGREQYGWFDDGVTLSPKNAPPLSEQEAGELREARRKLGKDLVYAAARIPSVDALPPAQTVAKLHQVLSKMKEIEAHVTDGTLLPLKAVTPPVLDAARNLVRELDQALALVEELSAAEGDWPFELRIKCLLPSCASEREALEALFSELDRLIEARAALLKRPVELPEPALGSAKARAAVARAAQSGKPFGVFSLGDGDAKALVAAIRVAGLSPSSQEDWQLVERFIALHEEVLSFVTRWNEFCEELAIPRLEGGVRELRRIERVANTARKAHRLATQFDAVLPKRAEKVFERVPTKKLTGDAEQLQSVREQLLQHLTRASLSEAAIELASLQEKLAGTSGPVSEDLRLLVEKALGNPAFPAERVAAEYAEILVELRRIGSLASELAVVNDFAARLAAAGAEKLARRIRNRIVGATGEDTAFPSTWRAAWNWARMKSHLDSIESRKELLDLAGRRRDLETGLQRLYQDMVAHAAWLSTKKSATSKVLAALAGYATAIRKIGLGTGPNAIRHRRDARDAMQQAVNAVPCWIMNHGKISESMPPDIGGFDLVIVDEASQSDLWALPAVLRGKKLLIVGDDKQVSPEAGFISAQTIQSLRNRFLTNQPYAAQMTPDKSLYDIAYSVFAGEQVMLREHFRCVPPIIAYSNRVFYKNGIHPIRIPRASERIDPPLVDVYVPDGHRDAHDCNDAEAQFIAAEIEALLEDDKFAGRSIGVVSLLGMDQAKRIDTLVHRRCDTAELLRRRFECGDARTFQGSERDIMFLSLVVDSGNCRAVSGIMFDQRFNVAASRARDREYLVRSVEASHLSEKDLRLTLLSHFGKPIVNDEEESENLLERCESGFEREVFTTLTEKGYRVVPQVRTGAYRIDMVVEGAEDNRLAIECDGDEFHGPDQWQHDMTRQRILERAGWVFWRCFASTWTLRRDEVLNELLDRLTAMGIEPLGSLDRAPSLVEKRTWSPPSEEEDDETGLALANAIKAASGRGPAAIA